MQRTPFLLTVLTASLAVHSLGAADRPLRDVIDEEIRQGWQEQQLPTPAQAEDATFLRRVYLDLVGSIPTHAEAKQFLDDPDPQRRARLIDRLLDDPRFAAHQTEVWDLILFTRSPPGNNADQRDGFRKWLHDQFARNVPYDRWVRQILKAEGNTVDQGPPMYLVQFDRRPEDATEVVTQTFLGVQLQCARCHDHPFESWSQKDFYGMAAFLARLEMVTVGKAGNVSKLAIGEKNTGDILFTGPAKDQKPGMKGEPIAPRFLQGAALQEPPAKDVKEERFPTGKMPPPPAFSRKDRLADWVTAPDNPYFARAIANRIWGQFMGRGIAHPVDNLSNSNPPSHPELLDALAQEMVAHKFDLKWYIRELCNSQVYQLAATGPAEAAMPRWFERARVRPLSAEELISSWRVATGFEDAEKASGKKADDRYRPLGSGYLLSFFGRPTDGTGEFQGGLREHLYLNNGPLSQLINCGKGGLTDTLMQSKEPWEARVDRLFLSVLSRPPRPEEREKFVAFITENDNDREISGRLSEAVWVLITCSEFRFNH